MADTKKGNLMYANTARAMIESDVRIDSFVPGVVGARPVYLRATHLPTGCVVQALPGSTRSSLMADLQSAVDAALSPTTDSVEAGHVERSEHP